MSKDSNIAKDELKAIMSLAVGKKSIILAYILWFFLGGLGVHRFYLGKIFTGLMMAALTGLGVLTSPIGIGVIFFLIVGIWWVLDAILIFLGARKANKRIDDAIDRL